MTTDWVWQIADFCYVAIPFLSIEGRSGSGIALIVSPLAALMLEQKGVFSQMELNCEFLVELQMDEVIFRKLFVESTSLLYSTLRIFS